MLDGSATESDSDLTDVELNSYAGGLNPNLITAAYGAETLASTTGLMSRGPTVSQALSRTGLSGTRVATSTRNALSAARASRIAMTAARMGLGRAAALAGGPVGIAILAVQIAAEEYLARLEESNAGMAESLAGGTRREGNTVYDVDGNPLAEFTDVSNMESGSKKASAVKGNAISEAQSKLEANKNDILYQVGMAKKAWDEGDDAGGRIHLNATLDLLKMRKTYAANLSGILGFKAGSPEADSLLRLSPRTGSDDYEVKRILHEIRSDLWWTEWNDVGKVDDVLESMEASSNTKEFAEISDRRRRNFEASQRAMEGETSRETKIESMETPRQLEPPSTGSQTPTVTNNNREGDRITTTNTTNIQTLPERPVDPYLRGTAMELGFG